MAQSWNEKGLHAASNAHTEEEWRYALECWNNSLEIYQTLTPNSQQVANVQNNRGIALGKIHRTTEALRALREALRIRKLFLLQDADDDDDDPSSSSSTTDDPLLVVVGTLHNIANVQQEANQLPDALQTLAEAKHTLWNTTPGTTVVEDDGDGGDSDEESRRRRHLKEKWHQSARICVAMG
jgi:tetratricopeptide (TPR) repeat protein